VPHAVQDAVALAGLVLDLRPHALLLRLQPFVLRAEVCDRVLAEIGGAAAKSVEEVARRIVSVVLCLFGARSPSTWVAGAGCVLGTCARVVSRASGGGVAGGGNGGGSSRVALGILHCLGAELADGDGRAAAGSS
jgi:uncharacterized protein (DUF697 family)